MWFCTALFSRVFYTWIRHAHSNPILWRSFMSFFSASFVPARMTFFTLLSPPFRTPLCKHCTPSPYQRISCRASQLPLKTLHEAAYFCICQHRSRILSSFHHARNLYICYLGALVVPPTPQPWNIVQLSPSGKKNKSACTCSFNHTPAMDTGEFTDIIWCQLKRGWRQTAEGH